MNRANNGPVYIRMPHAACRVCTVQRSQGTNYANTPFSLSGHCVRESAVYCTMHETSALCNVHRRYNNRSAYALVHAPCRFYDYIVWPQNVNRVLCIWCMSGTFAGEMLNANSPPFTQRQCQIFECHSFGRSETINKSCVESAVRVATKGVNNAKLPQWFDTFAHEAFGIPDECTAYAVPECRWLNKSFMDETTYELRILWHHPSIPVSNVKQIERVVRSDGILKSIKLSGVLESRSERWTTLSLSLSGVYRNRIDKKPHTHSLDMQIGTQHTLFVDLVSMSTMLSTMLQPHSHRFNTFYYPIDHFVQTLCLYRCIHVMNHDSIECVCGREKESLARAVQSIQQVLADSHSHRYDSLAFNLVWSAENN